MAPLRARADDLSLTQRDAATPFDGGTTDHGVVPNDSGIRLGPPRGAVRFLAFGMEASVLGILAIVGSQHAEGVDRPLLIVGWAFLLISAVCLLLFAARSEQESGAVRRPTERERRQ